MLKVKEPLAVEYARIRRGQMLFTYLHLAPAPELTRALIDSGAICIAYETVETDDRRLPLLAPMSEVAGRLAPQMGAHALERPQGGRGMLLGGVAGVAPAKVVVLGGGIVGYNAALIAVGMQADVWILDRSIDRMRELDPMLDGRATIVMSTTLEVERALEDADLVIGAVLVPGARAPKLVTREMLGLMRPGAVLVDVAIDQGGCFETSHPTTHSDPTYVVDGVVHYCVANMPGAVPISSTRALTNATLPVPRAPGRSWLRARNRHRSRARAGGQRRRRPGHLAARCRGAWPFRSSRLPSSSAKRRSQSVKKLPSRGLERAGIGPRKKEKSMSSDTSRTDRRPHRRTPASVSPSPRLRWSSARSCCRAVS